MSKHNWKNDKGDDVPEICPKCGERIGIFLRGEPVYLCTNKKCHTYFGTVPFRNKPKTVKENALTTDKRNALRNKTFGIPELRKYPMNDREHVISAIRYFNHVDSDHEEELAKNVVRMMKRYNISPSIVGDKNRLKKYIQE